MAQAMNKIRSAKYQIGQVVRHRLFPFRGVVFDIDPIFNNTEEWYQSIPAEVRPNKDQPFYHLFAENDETEYIAYVSEQNHWMLQHHGIFQGYYYFQYLGIDREMRERFRGHPMYEPTARFCAIYDQNSFDPAYETMPLEAFAPMVQRVFGTVQRSVLKREPQPA